MSPEDVLRLLNEVDERHDIEAKALRHSAGDAVFKSICAFANQEGGWILCGVQRVGTLYDNDYEVTGVDDLDRIQLEIQTGLQRFSRTPLLEFTPAQLNGRKVLLVRVHPLSPHPYPLFFEKLGYPRGVFLRKGSTDYQCDKEDIPYLADLVAAIRFEDSRVDGSKLGDLDPAAIREYRKIRETRDLHSEEHQLSEKEFLECRNSITGVDGKEVPTVCGILLFGTVLAMERFFANSRIVYHRVPGRDYRSDPGQLDGDLTRVFPICLTQSVPAAITQILDDLFVRVHYEENSPLQRIDTKAVGYRVLRECLVNAVTHRCYHESAPIHVIRYANRLVLTNPGHSLMPMSRLGANRSRCRNDRLSAALRSIGWAENLGLGIGILRSKMQEAGMPRPVFDDDATGNFFTTVLILEPFDHSSMEGWLSAWDANLEIGPLDAQIAFYALQNGAVNQSIVQSIEFDDAETASSHLHKLEACGFLIAGGARENRHYKVADDAAAMFDPITNQLKSEAVALRSEALRLKSEAVAPRSEVRGLGGADSSDQDDPTDPPEQFSVLLNRIRGKRPKSEIVRKGILELCSWEPYKLRSLARYLGRESANTLYTNHIAELVRNNLLETVYSENPSHPNQRYKTTEEGLRFLVQFAGL
ncbi:MAG: RNA-binding domain-containing protein [Fuerstiella sp.]